MAPLCAKVRNIPLGIEDRKYYELKSMRRPEQDIDIFYCGQPTSTLRLTAVEKLKELSVTTDWNIFIADSLPFNEYCDKISRSKVTVSISGGGWDCFRHYEAVALGSVPLMDRPTVDTFWWQNMPEYLFFDNRFKEFKCRLERMILDLSLRTNCLAQLEETVESCMLHSTIVKYMVYSSL